MSDSEKLDCLTEFMNDLIYTLETKGLQMKMEYGDSMLSQECQNDADKYRQRMKNILYDTL